jgi:hypothetical protein
MVPDACELCRKPEDETMAVEMRSVSSSART